MAFVDILNSAQPTDFLGTKYTRAVKQTSLDHIPGVPDTVAHLKLLRAFGELKHAVVGTDHDPDYIVKTWQVFVTRAVKRFVVFVSGCKYTLSLDPSYEKDEHKIFTAGAKRNPRSIAMLDRALPPLDVLMVWHSFLLNPRAFYDCFIRNQLLEFANFPFPLRRVHELIDNNTFWYDPDAKSRKAYEAIVRDVSADEDDWSYSYEDFSMYERLVSVYCPVCGDKILKDIPYTNSEKVGFADESFRWTINSGHCTCEFSRVITHEELRKRQLYADITSDTVLPNTYRYYSSVISHKFFKNRPTLAISDMVKKALVSTDSATFRKSLLADLIQIAALLRGYLSMNLIHTLVPNAIQISEDLVGCVMRQERFVEKMNEIDWLHSSLIRESLYESSIRYSRFFKLLSSYDDKKMMVPTLDIDLIWHTHQLSMFYYFGDCRKSRKGFVIDHDDKVEESRLDEGFERTAKVYREKFKQEYSICKCWYCVAIRSLPRSKLSKIFGRKLLAVEETTALRQTTAHRTLGLTHASLHNAITLPTDLAMKREAELLKKYGGKKVPWRDDSPANMYSMYPMLFVVPPMAPIALGDCSFYGQTLCCTIRDFGSNCLNMCSGMQFGLCASSFYCSNGGGGSNFFGSTGGAGCGGSGGAGGAGCGGGCGGGGCGGGGN
ncbi:uncharacterized protein CANTADRAFT_48284 [Suhomyces tanzawaensis NRRL Y-17324]|uniref:Uncharacterized protein n=1 Tax=Suhomyces tanzawaensis NRRL Y-17324 TaxID=984487 RepID=A0A1E4SNP5_9ASCO|nr:uncharacterized protein CANTADRAFT_48284 [Suhomyces tanzawaensis NRRL Y-17324]ODV81144.1 hypothetical protein CANTADRAFT_48284 [Suhomyces tanzawaensis NRRL Y-17324]